MTLFVNTVVLAIYGFYTVPFFPQMRISNIDNFTFINLADTFMQHVLQTTKNVIFDFCHKSQQID